VNNPYGAPPGAAPGGAPNSYPPQHAPPQQQGYPQQQPYGQQGYPQQQQQYGGALAVLRFLVGSYLVLKGYPQQPPQQQGPPQGQYGAWWQYASRVLAHSP
jgi:hypothetical protein